MDLFVGSRVIPGNYPFDPSSTLLVNENGKLLDKTKELAPELNQIGMVTDAIWVDYDNDNDLDLVITGEWMPITIMKNTDGKLTDISESSTLGRYKGWWYSISSGDFDQDGDIDFVAGNLGLNSKYQTNNGPLEVYAGDLDNNGRNDIVLGYHSNGSCYPLRGKSCSSQQMPVLSNKIPTYDLFGNATIFEVYGDALNKALHKEANWFASSYIENLGGDAFRVSPLPNHAQFSPINSSIPFDVNEDGFLDLILVGNMWGAEIETCRHDASFGTVLIGDGTGNFKVLKGVNLFADGDIKDMKIIKNKDQSTSLLIGKNDRPVKILKYNISVD